MGADTAASFLPLLVAVVYAYSGWTRWGLAAGLLFFFMWGYPLLSAGSKRR
jgi:hypothetical protein